MKECLRVLLLLACAALVVVIGCRRMPPEETKRIATYPVAVKEEPSVRVLAYSGKEPLRLAVDGSYRLTVTLPDGATREGGDGQPVSIDVAVTESGIRLGADVYREARIEPVGGTRIRLSWTRGGESRTILVRWPLRLMRSEAGNLWAIPSVPMEQYLVGVLPNEMYLSWPPEALKAQAVASRTYAFYMTLIHKARDFDVTATVMSQVWNPTDRADPRAVMAVQATHGVVMTENFRVFPAYFHACSGGIRTANARHVFGNSDVNALRGVPEAYGTSRSAPWRYPLSKTDLAERLRRHGISGGSVMRIRLLNEDRQPLHQMDRVYFVEVTYESGVVKSIPVAIFRNAVGHGKDHVAGSWFWAVNREQDILFEGFGAGHGVGMSQFGAMYLAKGEVDNQPRHYTDILRHYYPGIVLVRLYGTGDDPNKP